MKTSFQTVILFIFAVVCFILLMIAAFGGKDVSLGGIVFFIFFTSAVVSSNIDEK